MVLSTESVLDMADVEPSELFVQTYKNAVVYGDMEGETVLHEGEARVLANGWVELPTGRLLSPSAVHHVDAKPDGNS